MATNDPIFAPDVMEAQQLQQKQALAQAMMQQGMQNNGQTQMVGPVAVRNSPVAGLSQMLGAYLGGRMNRDATQKLQGLAEQKRQRMANILSQGMQKLKDGDSQGAVQVFASDPQTAPYVQEILKSQLAPNANKSSLTPTYFMGKDGKPHAYQLHSGGGATELDTGGMTPILPTSNLNMGNAAYVVDRAGNIVAGGQKGIDPNNIYNQSQQTQRQFNEPTIEGEKAQQKAIVERQQSNIDKANALKYYQTARQGLVSGLSRTSTGYVQGKLPAITTGQQVAEGSVAAMAPVLKQLFRQAGEGTFTDKDQQLLLNMLPTRSDNAEARAAKLANIDAIVQAKLAPTGQMAPTPQPQNAPAAAPKRLKFNPATGELE